jgi:hypothetical protein
MNKISYLEALQSSDELLLSEESMRILTEALRGNLSAYDVQEYVGPIISEFIILLSDENKEMFTRVIGNILPEFADMHEAKNVDIDFEVNTKEDGNLNEVIEEMLDYWKRGWVIKHFEAHSPTKFHFTVGKLTE